MSGAEAFETGISNEKPQHGKDAERSWLRFPWQTA